MDKNNSVILISNYPPDRQESMRRFAEGLAADLRQQNVEVTIWVPTAFLAKGSKSTVAGFGKWLAYVDKWIIFPIVIFFRLYFQGYHRYKFHICDHSNSPYLAWLPKSKTVITCHDVLAIRGAFGYADAYCPASTTGKILQKWILKNLGKAVHLTTVSHYTMRQLLALLGKSEAQKPKGWSVIHNTFNADFYPLSESETVDQLKHYPQLSRPFLLHIGSGLLRKNRKLLIDMLSELKDTFQGVVCFAGDALDSELKERIQSLDLNNRVVSIYKPDHKALLALYSSCTAFVFPSFSEGFGWPVIEAQACGAPVIASNLDPMLEVAGGAALHASPDSGAEFAAAFSRLQEPGVRDNLVQAGYHNCRRFNKESIVKSYLKTYESLS